MTSRQGSGTLVRMGKASKLIPETARQPFVSLHLDAAEYRVHVGGAALAGLLQHTHKPCMHELAHLRPGRDTSNNAHILQVQRQSHCRTGTLLQDWKMHETVCSTCDAGHLGRGGALCAHSGSAAPAHVGRPRCGNSGLPARLGPAAGAAEAPQRRRRTELGADWAGSVAARERARAAWQHGLARCRS